MFFFIRAIRAIRGPHFGLGRSLAAWALLRWPSTEDPSQHDQLSQVVGVMVCDEQRLAQDGLAIAVRDSGEQIGCWVGHQVLHRLEVRAEGAEASVPGGRIGWPVAFGPVAFWERW